MAGDKPRLSGYAVVYGPLSETFPGGLRERFRQRAFADALGKKPDVRALIDHTSHLVLGRTAAGTLVLREDDTGVHFDVELPDTTYARDLAEVVRRGDVTGMSFGFSGPVVEWAEGATVREITRAVLHEISVATFPYYPDTTVAVRTWSEFKRDRIECQLAGRFRWAELAEREL